MGAKETLLMTLRPHPLSFLRYYSVGIVLLLWLVLTFWLHHQDWMGLEWPWDVLDTLTPALFLALGAVIVGKWLVDDFGRWFQYLYWFAIIVLLVVTGLFIWYWDDSAMATYFTFLFGSAIGVMAIVFAEFFRRAFRYMVTNQRIVLRYRLLDVEETNIRFEKIEDFEILRPLWFRIVGLGIIRPYTGTEDAKADEDLEFHGPKEALYGIRKPNEVKRQLIEIILERDQWDKQMVDLLEEQKRKRDAGPAPGPRPRPKPAAAPEPEPAPEPATAPEPAASAEAPESPVAYYQPAPEPEPEPAPARNYERIDPSQYAGPDTGDEGAMDPPPPDEEEDPGEAPSPVRRMYPEARDVDASLQMEDAGSMDFQRGQRERRSSEEEDWNAREEEEDAGGKGRSKPRSL